MTDRKKPGMAFWITVILVAIPFLYLLSFGPACWISSRTNVGAGLVTTVYRPMLQQVLGRPIGKIISWYAYVGAAHDWKWGCGSHSDDWEWFYAETF